MVGFITLTHDGPIRDSAIKTLQQHKIQIPILSIPSRGTSSKGIPIPHNNQFHNHHHQYSNFNKGLVANRHPMSMCLPIRRHKRTPIN